ncbi:MAG: hypothetical protein LBE56_12445 [Tannerella sp.]|jgi:hypothetical protein|nr:hypothetical protein [Tannerella sp.]
MAVMNYGKCMVTGTNSELLLYYEIDSSSITEKITNKTTLIPSTGIEKLDAPYASGIGIRNSNISFYYLDVNERNQINYLKNSDKWSHGAWINLSKLGVDSYYRNIFMMFRATADIQILSIRQDDPVNPIIFSTFAVKEQVLGNVNVKVDSINV